jgi:hypothetical protein
MCISQDLSFSDLLLHDVMLWQDYALALYNTHLIPFDNSHALPTYYTLCEVVR